MLLTSPQHPTSVHAGILFVLLSIQVWYKKLGMSNVDLNDLESWDFGDGENTVVAGGKTSASWFSQAESKGQKRGYAEIPRDNGGKLAKST